jgi:glycosyltransferase involved in cell wall biosynthesis
MNESSWATNERPVPVSAIICTRNRPDLIGNAVLSVLENIYPALELLVVDQSDDGSTANALRELLQQRANLHYLHTSPPGLSRARNIGVREAAGDVIAFTDDDCMVPPDWISTIVAVFQKNLDVDMLYGQVERPVALEKAAGYVPTLLIPKTRRLSRRDGFEIYGMGANFAARRSLFERIGGFDEALGVGGPLGAAEDFDFEYRAYRAGASILLEPEVKVDHYGTRVGEQWVSTLRSYGLGDGAFYFKHVRCGDLFALRLLVARLARLSVRELLSWTGLRPRGSLSVYLQSCLRGIRVSLRYPINKDRRLYRHESGSLNRDRASSKLGA